MICTRTTWTRLGAVAGLAVGLALGAESVLAQESTPGAGEIDLTSALVALHEGTCDRPAADPWAELGQPHLDDLDDAAGPTGSELAPESFVREDQDGDGELDEGEDRNQNGTLDVGVDTDSDGMLEASEIISGELADSIPRAYLLTAQVDAGFEALFGQENVLVVHQSADQDGTILACGELGGIDPGDESEAGLDLSPVAGSQVSGHAVFDTDVGLDSEATTVTVQLFSNLPPQSDEGQATPTP